MSPALEQAFSEIEKGAEERLEVLRSKKEHVEVGEVSVETVPKLIGHMEKVEEEDLDKQMGADRRWPSCCREGSRWWIDSRQGSDCSRRSWR